MAVAAALAAALLLTLGQPARAAEDSGTVTGRLLVLGAPVAEARVVVRSAARSSYEGTGTTDAQGAFSISGVPMGEAEVLARGADDALLARGRCVLNEAGQTVTVELAPATP